MDKDLSSKRPHELIPLAYQRAERDKRRSGTATLPGIIGSMILLLMGIGIAFFGVLVATELGAGCAVITLPVAGAFIAMAMITFRHAVRPDQDESRF